MGDISIQFTELVKTLSDDYIKSNFSKIDKTKIALALKTIDPKISEKIFKNLSENDSEEIKSKMSGVISIEEIETIQLEIIKMIQK